MFFPQRLCSGCSPLLLVRYVALLSVLFLSRSASATDVESTTDSPDSSSPDVATRATPTTPSVATHLPDPDEATGDGTSGSDTTSGTSGDTADTTENATGYLAPSALPTGADKSGVTTKTLSVPKGSGSIEGMGESFSTQLSTGVATFSVPFALPKARGAAQPSLGLSYSSGSGQGLAGLGWSVGVPFIARQTDRGVPKYNEESDYQEDQDHFVFNGGQELVPICTVNAGLTCSEAISQSFAVPGAAEDADEPGLSETMPAWSAGWQYFRPRVEGSFLRFFWSPNHRTWRVQDKNGVTLELGVPLNEPEYLEAIERNAEPSNLAGEEIYRWHLVRQFDSQGTGNAAVGAMPVNVVVYRYAQEGGQALLTDIYDTPPAGPDAGTQAYAHHVRLRYETRPDPSVSYRSGWALWQLMRLSGVDVSSKTFNQEGDGARRMVRRYHLSYAADYHQSLLESVVVEGRCGQGEGGAPSEGSDGGLEDTSCPTLPAMTFAYEHVSPLTVDGDAGSRLEGYEGFDERLMSLEKSPKHSLDEELTDLFDVNSDGLPDVLVTAPGVYGSGHGVFFNGVNGSNGFGKVTEMSVSGVLDADAATITLRNMNVTPLDLDGDGRVNFLHMPQTQTYALYSAVEGAKGWSWEGREVETATRQNPKIDSARTPWTSR